QTLLQPKERDMAIRGPDLHFLARAVAAIAVLAALTGVAARAKAPEDDLGGRVTALVDGREIALPALHTDVSVDIEGDLASVRVVQTFENPTGVPLNATYLFPLNENAAVHAMTMAVGDEVVTAQIQKTEQARAVFEAAKQEGRAAALLTQHRPN